MSILQKGKDLLHATTSRAADIVGAETESRKETPEETEAPKPLGAAMALRLLAAAVLLAVAFLIPAMPTVGSWLLAIAAAVCGGFEVYRATVRQLCARRVNAMVLFTIASVLLFCIARPAEGAGVILLLVIGKAVLQIAREHSRNLVLSMADVRPEYALLYREDGTTSQLSPAEVQPGQLIFVPHGELVPLDCRTQAQDVALELAAYTGSTEAERVQAGGEIPAGARNIGQDFIAEVVRDEENSAACVWMRTLENSDAGRDPQVAVLERRWERVTLVAGIAAAVVLVVCLATGQGGRESIGRTVTLLALSGPFTALAAVPMFRFAGAAGMAGRGSLLHQVPVLDKLCRVRAVAFDKNGTLTTGSLRVTAVKSERMESEMFLQIAAAVEGDSAHPIAQALRTAAGVVQETAVQPQEQRFVPGCGVAAKLNGVYVTLGSYQWMEQLHIQGLRKPSPNKAVYMAVQGKYAGCAELGETIRPDAAEAIYTLDGLGCDRVAMLSSDTPENCAGLAKSLGIPEYYAACQPEEKQVRLHQMQEDLGPRGGSVLYVKSSSFAEFTGRVATLEMELAMPNGDSAGADIWSVEKKLGQIPFLVQTARSIRRQVKLGFLAVCAVKLLFVILAIVGFVPAWAAVIADLAAGFAVTLYSVHAYELSGRPGKRRSEEKAAAAEL